jgi:hypothetical protein
MKEMGIRKKADSTSMLSTSLTFSLISFELSRAIYAIKV